MTTARVLLPSGSPPPWSQAPRRIWFEIYLGWRYIAGDVPTAVLPSVAFTIAAAQYAELSWPRLLVVAFESALLFCLFGYTFCSSNQARAGDEDKINKPYRAIPSGLVTSRGTLVRYWVASAVYTVLGIWFGVWPWVLAWQLTAFVLNFLLDRHWVVKPISMYAGTLFQLAAAWQLVTPLDATAWQWIAVIVLVFVSGLISEDLRDVHGDRSVRRTRLVMLVGHWPIRIFSAAICLATPVVYHFALYSTTGSPVPVVLACDAVVAGLSWLAAVRLLTVRDHGHGDHVTYMIYCYGYTMTTACGIALFW